MAVARADAHTADAARSSGFTTPAAASAARHVAAAPTPLSATPHAAAAASEAVDGGRVGRYASSPWALTDLRRGDPYWEANAASPLEPISLSRLACCW